MDLVTPVTRDCCQDPCNISEGRSVQQNVNHPLPIPVDFITCFPLVIDKVQNTAAQSSRYVTVHPLCNSHL